MRVREGKLETVGARDILALAFFLLSPSNGDQELLGSVYRETLDYIWHEVTHYFVPTSTSNQGRPEKLI